MSEQRRFASQDSSDEWRSPSRNLKRTRLDNQIAHINESFSLQNAARKIDDSNNHSAVERCPGPDSAPNSPKLNLRDLSADDPKFMSHAGSESDASAEDIDESDDDAFDAPDLFALFCALAIAFGPHFCKTISSLKPFYVGDTDWNPESDHGKGEGLTNAQWGLFQSAIVLPTLVIPVVGALLSQTDSGMKSSLAFFGFLVLAGTIMFWYATVEHMYWLALLGRITTGCGEGVMSSMSGTIAALFFQGKRLAFAMGVVESFHALSISLCKALVAPVADLRGVYSDGILLSVLATLFSFLVGVYWVLKAPYTDIYSSIAAPSKEVPSFHFQAQLDAPDTVTDVASTLTAKRKTVRISICVDADSNERDRDEDAADAEDPFPRRQRSRMSTLRSVRSSVLSFSTQSRPSRPSAVRKSVTTLLIPGAAPLQIFKPTSEEDIEEDQPRDSQYNVAHDPKPSRVSTVRSSSKSKSKFDAGAASAVEILSPAAPKLQLQPSVTAPPSTMINTAAAFEQNLNPATGNTNRNSLVPPSSPHGRRSTGRSTIRSSGGGDTLSRIDYGESQLAASDVGAAAGVGLFTLNSTYWGVVMLHFSFSLPHRVFGHIDAAFFRASCNLDIIDAGLAASTTEVMGVIMAPLIGYLVDQLAYSQGISPEVLQKKKFGVCMLGCFFAAVCGAIGYGTLAFSAETGCSVSLHLPLFLLSLTNSMVPTLLRSTVPQVLKAQHFVMGFAYFECAESLGVLIGGFLVGMDLDSYGMQGYVFILCIFSFLLAAASGLAVLIFVRWGLHTSLVNWISRSGSRSMLTEPLNPHAN